MKFNPHFSSVVWLVVGIAIGVSAVSVWRFATEKPTQTLDSSEYSTTPSRYQAFDECRHIPPDVLGVEEPIEVIESDIFADGGTTYVTFRDATGKSFAAVLLSHWTDDAEFHRYRFGPAVGPEPLMIPDAKNPATALTYRGPEERALCGLLARWAKEFPSFWLLLSADQKSMVSWSASYSRLLREDGGKKVYTRNRALAFTLGMLGRQSEN